MPRSTDINALVERAYRERYERLEKIKIRTISRSVFNGSLALATFTAGGWQNEQLCFVDKDGPIIFESEAELARFIEHKAKGEPLIDRFFGPRIVSGFVFVLFAIALIVGLFDRNINVAVLTIIGGAVGSAGTFFYQAARVQYRVQSLSADSSSSNS